MVPSLALIMMVAAGAVGWLRATRRGGTRADCWQYAAAHAIPAFLIGMIVITVIMRMVA